MYLFTSVLEKLEDKPDWFNSVLEVFRADFTYHSDKLVLVDVILGLYAFSLVLAMLEGATSLPTSASSWQASQAGRRRSLQHALNLMEKSVVNGSALLKRINENKNLIFPPELFADTVS